MTIVKRIGASQHARNAVRLIATEQAAATTSAALDLAQVVEGSAISAVGWNAHRC